MPDRGVPAPSGERPDIDRLADAHLHRVLRALPEDSTEYSVLAARASAHELVAIARTLRDCETQERQLRTAVRECCDALKAAEARVAELERERDDALRKRDEHAETFAEVSARTAERVAELEAENERLREEARKGQEPLAHLILDATTILRAHRIARAALAGDRGGA